VVANKGSFIHVVNCGTVLTGRGESEGEVISMCLGIPGKIVAIEKNVAKVDVGGILRDISIDLCPDVSVGEYILIHTGFAIQRVDEEEAKETLDLLKKMAGAI
jgi:hydrogenase expression/formation protein HypC